MRLFFLTIPKPLKQYTLLKKDYPFRWYLCVYNKNFPMPKFIYSSSSGNIIIDRVKSIFLISPLKQFPTCTYLLALLRIKSAELKFNLFDFLDNSGSNQRQHNFMMACQVESPPPVGRGPVHHIGHRTVVPDKIHIHGGEIIQPVA
jgi:hypothetical protein